MANNMKRESQATPKLDRRAFGKAVMAGVLGGPAALSSIAEVVEGQTPSNKRIQGSCSGMKLALMLRLEDKDRWVLARQIGVNHAIVPLSSALNKITRDKYRRGEHTIYANTVVHINTRCYLCRARVRKPNTL